MLKDAIFDFTNKGTLWPNVKLLCNKGAAFYLMQLPN
jgi:hypothetical protein